MVKVKGDFGKVWYILSNEFSVANINISEARPGQSLLLKIKMSIFLSFP